MGVRIIGPNVASLISQTNQIIIDHSERALDKVANATLLDAKSNAPVDTGALRADIAIYSAPLLRQIGNNIHYAIYQEYGTYKMKAHPFLFPAFEANRQSLIDDLQNMKVI